MYHRDRHLKLTREGETVKGNNEFVVSAYFCTAKIVVNVKILFDYIFVPVASLTLGLYN